MAYAEACLHGCGNHVLKDRMKPHNLSDMPYTMMIPVRYMDPKPFQGPLSREAILQEGSLYDPIYIST